MASARRLKVNVLVSTPEGSGQQSQVFGPDDTDIPEWAAEQIGDHAWDDGDSASSDGGDAPAKKTAAKRSAAPKK